MQFAATERKFMKQETELSLPCGKIVIIARATAAEIADGCAGEDGKEREMDWQWNPCVGEVEEIICIEERG